MLYVCLSAMAELETFVPSKHNRPTVLAGSRLDLQFVSVTAVAEKNSEVRTNHINEVPSPAER